MFRSTRLCEVKKLVLLALFVLLAACEPEPIPVLGPSLAALDSTPTVQGAIAPEPTRGASSEPAMPPAPTPTRGPGGKVTIAGIGAPSREITALPEFVMAGLFDSLLRVDPQDGHLLPGLAERWQVSEDSKTFTFTLRGDLEWHDGEPLTAEDVVFSLQALSDPDIRVRPAADFGPMTGITAADAQTVRVTFDDAYCAALTFIGTIPILPKHRLETKSLANVAEADLIGSGPLVLKTWTDDSLTFTRNIKYWNGAPQIIDWTYKIFADAESASDAVRAGEADLVIGDSPIASKSASPLILNEFYALAFNTRRPPLDQVAVRRAIASALNRPQIAGAPSIQQTTLESSVLDSFWAEQDVSQPEFNLVQARGLLASRGWRDTDGDGILDKEGKPLQLTLWLLADDPRSETTAQLMRAELAKVGVSAVLKMTDRTLFLTRLLLQEYDLALAHLNVPLDPDQYYFWGESEDEPGYGLNVTGYINPRVQEALAAGNTIPRCAMDARKTAYAPMFEQLAADTPMLFLFAPTTLVNFDPAIEGITPSSFAGPFWNLNTWHAVR